MLEKALVIDLISYYIIFFSIYITAFLIFKFTSKLEISTSKIVFISCCIFIIPFLMAMLRINEFPFYRLLFLIFVVASFCFIKIDNFFYILPISIIAIGISYFIELISVLILSIILFIMGFREIYIINDILSLIIQLSLVLFLLKIKRIRNGFPFFEDKSNFGIGLLISAPVILVTSLQKENANENVLTLIVFATLVFSIGIFFWIRSAITKHYRKRLKLRAEEYSKIELTEKEKEIERLSDENTSLSSIIHLDNHIIQSIESELKALNNTNLTDKLLTSINQRNEYVNDLLIKSKNLASTGNAEIDAVLLDLYIKSASRGIDYNLSADCDINYLINNIIPVSGFEALLRNLITNSIVDIENNPDIPGRISIKISQPNDIYELTVMDNGISKENNNSIPDIVEKAKASVKIKEFDNNASFTKSVTIRFYGVKTKQ